jgi:hypothetical protein
MTTTVLACEQALSETIAKTESALLSPPIPGELTAWITAVQEAAATLALNLAAWQRIALHRQYEEILQADSEMGAQVEKLIAEDNALINEVAEFHEKLHQLAEAAAHVDRNEGKLCEPRKRVEEQGIALLVSIKKHQVAATTWLGEAHFRDRGVQD